MTDDEKDELLDDATHAASNEFKERGITLTTEQLYTLNDFLTTLLAECE
jgi:hypothetical protein